jgi:hypothetical protein
LIAEAVKRAFSIKSIKSRTQDGKLGSFAGLTLKAKVGFEVTVEVVFQEQIGESGYHRSPYPARVTQKEWRADGARPPDRF